MNTTSRFIMNILFILSSLISILESAQIQFQNMTPYTTQIYGDIKVIGNSVLELDTTQNRNDNVFFRSDDQVSWGRNIQNGLLQDVWTGVVTDVSAYEANNFAYLRYSDIDNIATTYNSSSSTLNLASNSTIVYARLYWSGMIHNFANGNSINTKKIEAHTVELNIDGGAYNTITVSTADGYNATEGWTELYTDTGNLKYSRYSAYKDVTSLFSGLSFNGAVITVTVADVVSNEGWLRNYGNYGAWSLAVVYRNSNETFKHVSLYTGYEEVYGTPLSIPISGFLTPKSSSVVSNLSVFAIEGEKTPFFGQDYLKVQDKSGTLYDVSNNANYPNQSANIFDSTITNTETKNPNLLNTMGIDIDTFSIGKDGNLSHPQIIDNLQTATVIELSSGGDAYTVNALALSTELYVPTFCYDYAYKQNNRYFTEDNNGLKDPEIVGTIASGFPVSVTVFIRNLVDSDINVTNMIVNITDINTSQSVYVDGTVTLAKVGELTPSSVVVNSTQGYIRDIPIGTMVSNDYFYIDYNLNPLVADLNMSLLVTAEYNLTIGATVIPYTLRLGAEIPLCDSQNFNYTPTDGLFNIVHGNYYNAVTQYYNLPTQVLNRAGDFQVIALDEQNVDTLKKQSTIVAVEAIDASAFHTTDASCFEQSNHITDRKWVIFNDTNTTSVGTPADYFHEVRENTAFRVSYNLTNDGNTNLVQATRQNSGLYTLNFHPLTDGISACSQSVTLSNGQSTNIPATACGSGADISEDDLKACMECLYGITTKFVCSRDNFAIRPEAFLVKLNDQNQVNPNVKQRFADSISGVVSPAISDINLSAGYNYNIEINATTYTDSNQSLGYTKSYGLSALDTAEYTWEPRTAIANCNDVVSKNVDVRFVDGAVDTNTSINQVGDYRLNILDVSWTQVDSDPNYMSHHDGSIYFLNSSFSDCIQNTTIVQVSAATNAQPLIGCNISSNHTNTNTNIKYQDYNVTIHPYKFDISSILPTYGTTNTIPNAQSFIYMADLTKDENMSFHLNGSINAVGYNNTNLSNFVDQCYAKNILIDINTSSINLPTPYGYKLNIIDFDGTQLRTLSSDFNDINHSLTLLTEDFPASLNGSSSIVLNLNYTRNIANAINPQTITFYNYDVDCNISSECTFIADFNNRKTSQGSKNLNSATIQYYYGRTHAPRHKFTETNTIGDHNVSLNYEVYCNGAGCDKSLLQDGVSSSYTDDPRWFVNSQHTVSSGIALNVREKQVSGTLNVLVQPTGISSDFVTVNYDGSKGYPYVTTMENNASSWLIYNKYNASADKNEFILEFYKDAGGYVGSGSSTSDVKTTHSNTSNLNENKSWW